MLLLAGLMFSCSPSQTKEQAIGFEQAVQKVIIYGKPVGKLQKEIKFSTATLRYVVVVDMMDSTFTVARCGLFNSELQAWSIDIQTNTLKSFLNKDVTFGEPWGYQNNSTTGLKGLQQHFENEQKEVIKLICQKFWSTTGVSLVG